MRLIWLGTPTPPQWNPDWKREDQDEPDAALAQEKIASGRYAEAVEVVPSNPAVVTVTSRNPDAGPNLGPKQPTGQAGQDNADAQAEPTNRAERTAGADRTDPSGRAAQTATAGHSGNEAEQSMQNAFDTTPTAAAVGNSKHSEPQEGVTKPAERAPSPMPDKPEKVPARR